MSVAEEPSQMAMPSYFLTRPPSVPDAVTAGEFEALYAARLAHGDLIPYSLTAPVWQFLCWLADTKEILLHGSGCGEIAEFEPRQSDDIDEFGNRRAVYAASDGLWPIYFAIVDRERYHVSLTNGCFRVPEAGGLSQPYYFFSINQEALDRQPWRQGFVYLLPRETFEQQPPLVHREFPLAHVAQWASPDPVRPLARLAVGPDDFPFLSHIRGHDDRVLLERAAADPDGFPWLDDEEE